MTVTDDTTGEQLAESLLQGVGNEYMRAATRLLGGHRNGYWLRRFEEDQELAAAADRPLIDRTGTHPSVDWDAVGFLLMLEGPSALRASTSEEMVLQFAASLVGRCPLQLQRFVQAVDGTEIRLSMRALTEVIAYGDAG